MMLNRVLPVLGQLAQYDRQRLMGDLAAGVTVGVMLIPQGMAYALIAGLPPIYGLYAALVPLVVYALFGTSRQLAVGPVAMVSLLVAAGVGPLANGDERLYIEYAIMLALMVGVIQLALGLARFGFLTNFLSHPVLTGFTGAAALIIGFSQLKHLIGVDIPRTHLVHEIVWDAVAGLGGVHAITVVIGLVAVVALVVLRRRLPRAPGALVVVLLATAAVAILGLDTSGVAIVGSVPGGLPGPVAPSVDLSGYRLLFPTALTISLVGFMESFAVAKVYATKHRYDVDANQELVGLGLANIVGSVFQSFPTTGGFSRTAVNDQAGAQTSLAAIVSAIIIAITLLFLTGLFYHLPKAVLAAIVMVAVFKLIDLKEMRFLWRVDRRDFWLMAATFAATLSLGIEEGILVGVIASLVVVVFQSSTPHTAVMGKLPGGETFRNVERNRTAETTPGILVLRFDASLYFANAAFLKDRVASLYRAEPVEAIVFDFYPVNRVDATAVHAIKEVLSSLQASHVRVFFAGVKGPVMDRFVRAGISDAVGTDHFFHEVSQAARAAEASILPASHAAVTPIETISVPVSPVVDEVT